MSNSNKVKAEFLGMPYGTAMNRLRKQIMFKLAQELGYDICYKCEKVIETSNSLSIEHKEPWLNRPDGKALFWDLGNIAFSHIACNTPHRYKSENILARKVGPEGTAWCSVHKDFLPIEKFWRNKSRWNGLFAHCIDCYESNFRSNGSTQG